MLVEIFPIFHWGRVGIKREHVAISVLLFRDEIGTRLVSRKKEYAIHETQKYVKRPVPMCLTLLQADRERALYCGSHLNPWPPLRRSGVPMSAMATRTATLAIRRPLGE